MLALYNTVWISQPQATLRVTFLNHTFFTLGGEEASALVEARLILPQWTQKFPNSAFFLFLSGRLETLCGKFDDVSLRPALNDEIYIVVLILLAF